MLIKRKMNLSNNYKRIMLTYEIGNLLKNILYKLITKIYFEEISLYDKQN